MRVKIPLYAEHDVPEVWIVDLERNCARFYRSLVDGQYRQVSVTSEPDLESVPGLGDAEINLAKLIVP